MLFLLYQDLYKHKQHDSPPLVCLLQDAVQEEDQTVSVPGKHLRQATVRVLVSSYVYYRINPQSVSMYEIGPDGF